MYVAYENHRKGYNVINFRYHGIGNMRWNGAKRNDPRLRTKLSMLSFHYEGTVIRTTYDIFNNLKLLNTD